MVLYHKENFLPVDGFSEREYYILFAALKSA
jgi:hypothetical protein